MTVPTEKHHSSSIIFPILIIHFVHYYYKLLIIVMRKIHQIKIDHYIVPTSEIIFFKLMLFLIMREESPLKK